MRIWFLLMCAKVTLFSILFILIRIRACYLYAPFILIYRTLSCEQCWLHFKIIGNVTDY
jgi:hypothetical protein